MFELQLTSIGLGAPILLVGTHDYVDMDILVCTLHVLERVG